MPVPVSVTTLPTVPVTVQAPKVCVVDPSEIVWATVLVLASSVNWLLPLMVRVDVPVAPPMVSLLYERLPPAKDLADVLVSDKTILDVPLKKERLEDTAFQIVPVEERVQVPDPILKVLVEVFDASNEPTVTL